MAMTNVFLTLDDAVNVLKTNRHWLGEGYDTNDFIDGIIAVELEQKCFISDDQYSIGYATGLADSLNAIEDLIDGNDN